MFSAAADLPKQVVEAPSTEESQQVAQHAGHRAQQTNMHTARPQHRQHVGPGMLEDLLLCQESIQASHLYSTDCQPMPAQLQQLADWQQDLQASSSRAAACILPAEQPAGQQHSTQLLRMPAQSVNEVARASAEAGAPAHDTSSSAQPGRLMSYRVQAAACPPQGLCFSSPSSTADPSGSQHTTSSSSQDSRQPPAQRPARMQEPGTAGLLCDSPALSSDSMSMDSPRGWRTSTEGAHSPCSPAGHSHPASKRHCQHMDSDDKAGSGMQNHQVDVNSKPTFSLPSFHSMLGSTAAASEPQAAHPASAAEAVADLASAHDGRISSNLFGSINDQLPAELAAMQSSPCSPQKPAASPWTPPSCSDHTPALGTDSRAPATSTVPAGSPALGAGRGSWRELVEAFLNACSSPGAVDALAVLVQNKLLPVLPVLDEDESPSRESLILHGGTAAVLTRVSISAACCSR